MKLEVEIKPTPKVLAEAFAEMGDEEQAQFFIEVAALAKSWRVGGSMQWHYIGAHLRDCACSTMEARDMLFEISSAANAA